jgi:hypothetical protein
MTERHNSSKPLNVKPGAQGFQKSTEGKKGVSGGLAPALPVANPYEPIDVGAGVNARLDQLAAHVKAMRSNRDITGPVLSSEEVLEAARSGSDFYSMRSGGSWKAEHQREAAHWGVVRAVAEKLGKTLEVTREQVSAAAWEGRSEYVRSVGALNVDTFEAYRAESLSVARFAESVARES